MNQLTTQDLHVLSNISAGVLAELGILPKPRPALPQDLRSNIQTLVQISTHPDFRSEYLYDLANQMVQPGLTSLFKLHPTLADPCASAPEGEIAIRRDMPTIGVILPGGLTGAELLACASFKRQAQGMGAPNILFITPQLFSALSTVEVGAVTKLCTTSALVFDGLKLRAVEFKRAIPLDAVAGDRQISDNEWSWLRERGVTFVKSAEARVQTDDKIQCKKALETIGVETPAWRSLAPCRGWFSAAITVAKTLSLLTFSSESRYVVKPHDESCGRGVSIIDRSSLGKIIFTALETATEYGKALIESGVDSYPLFVCGQRKDWNIRALVSPEGLIDVEARVGEWGQPINKSLGAEIWELEAVIEHIKRHDPECKLDADEMRSQIEWRGRLIAENLGAEFLGLDIIFDAARTVWIIEVNDERSGGLSSLAEIRSSERALIAADKLSRYLYERYRNDVIGICSEDSVIPLPCDEQNPSLPHYLATLAQSLPDGIDTDGYIAAFKQILSSDLLITSSLRRLEIGNNLMQSLWSLGKFDHVLEFASLLATERAYYYEIPAEYLESKPSLGQKLSIEQLAALPIVESLRARKDSEGATKVLIEALSCPLKSNVLLLSVALEHALEHKNEHLMALIMPRLTDNKAKSPILARLKQVAQTYEGGSLS